MLLTCGGMEQRQSKQNKADTEHTVKKVS